MHLEVLILGDHARDVAVFVGVVAEMNRAGDTRGRAGRRRCGINAGSQAGRKSGIEAVGAEGTFVGNTEPFVMGAGALRRGFSGPVIALAFVGDIARLIRTGDHTSCAADAEVVVHRHQAIGAPFGRPGRAHGNARRLLAMLTPRDHEQALHIGKGSQFDIQNRAPLHTRRRRVLVLAGGHAGLATNAAVEIDHHPPSGHWRCPL